jgi:hypothetical protein
VKKLAEDALFELRLKQLRAQYKGERNPAYLAAKAALEEVGRTPKSDALDAAKKQVLRIKARREKSLRNASQGTSSRS